jgi:hypothetical protein
MRLPFCAAILALAATTAAAQQRPIFDPDDFVDPRTRGAALFVSRLVLGGGANLVDDYRPLRRGGAFLEVANSFYWSGFQIDHKHSRVYDGSPPPVQACPCQPPIYFPTAPTADSTPAASPQSSKETLQFARYVAWPHSSADPPVMLRYRLSWSRQKIDTVAKFLNTDVVASRLHGREQTFGLDADTHFRIGDRDVWGSLLYSRNARSGTTDDRAQNELAYTSRFPGLSIHGAFLLAQFTIGGVSGRGATGLNVVNPRFEVSWYHDATGANLHFVYRPQATRSGAGGWETHHQVALFADRALYAKMF